jgi:hypothetical protein
LIVSEEEREREKRERERREREERKREKRKEERVCRECSYKNWREMSKIIQSERSGRERVCKKIIRKKIQKEKRSIKKQEITTVFPILMPSLPRTRGLKNHEL